ncbi:MAG TPA: hypothetical protein PK836_01580 [Syntrophales bacterium]|nr:hypothetical protein [Syntrophales bacterium]HOM07073.1 hypothetical protein [Syntrophales bacterium]HON98890.1 hypothetical protein [Syntrophales bacterium]HPC00354.1 hypothetical protein [Syntrophales bacterium]HPQ06558.1 hypothetical protein [Syntrophales bacterium]
MLMLTHTWILKAFLGPERPLEDHLDLVAYNICPDFLPISQSFNSSMTHGVSRFRAIPRQYRKAAFIVFHLMVDDLSHHGRIEKAPVTDFNPESEGYSYLKGRSLVEPLMDLYSAHGQSLDYPRAVYRSHMVIEMTFDLSLYQALKEESERLVLIMCRSLQEMSGAALEEFGETVGWFYGVEPEAVREAVLLCAERYTLDRINRFMSLPGRITLFADKFGLESSRTTAYDGLRGIMLRGMDLVKDYGDFLDPTLREIRRAGFAPTF